ncbi:Kinase A inhibitor [Defluviimonas aquaemixtae]|uniref:Kinase A inhibitor n=1 Tax=Albidovulum aquaemixtae TaxID=1542388 RepID=A0A2R8BKD1_9RHOB|nr:carboxyltransferase domain-containing protein [Defluviimonas aquaemixtae]SPH23762.1 Kinase A inhibitor [Defluviimonas aquaemixtae]
MKNARRSIQPEALPLGQRGVLVRFSLTPAPQASGAVQQLCEMLKGSAMAGISEIAPSLTSVLVRFDPAKLSRSEVAAWLAPFLASEDWSKARPPAPRRRWLVPVAFGDACGPDLVQAANATGLTESQAVAEITDADLRVLAIGFAPGQPYLGLLPDRWNIPRQPQLTPRVPIGAVVVAVRQLVLFAAENATGWRHVGLSAFRPFQPGSDDPFPLAPGDAVRFVQISSAELESLRADGADPMGGARREGLS